MAAPALTVMALADDSDPVGGRGDARPPGRPRDERASRAITEAALRQLADVGYARVSMESVASEAGVARATVYRRYRDKADLVTAAIAGQHRRAIPRPPVRGSPADLVAYLEDFDERFAESCVEVVGHAHRLPGGPGGTGLAPSNGSSSPVWATSASLLVRAQELGELSRDADLDLAVQMLTGSVLARRVSGSDSRPGWARRAVDIVFGSVRQSSSASSSRQRSALPARVARKASMRASLALSCSFRDSFRASASSSSALRWRRAAVGVALPARPGRRRAPRRGVARTRGTP